MEWKTIDSAPRDNVPFLAFIPNMGIQIHFLDWSGVSSWRDSDYRPTHWTPLPPLLNSIRADKEM